METILYIDTSGQYSNLLLMRNDQVLAKRATNEANQHAQSINVHIQELMTEADLRWELLTAVAVMNGPGSYTGLRIGLATAKGFCYAHNLPLILINHLQLMQEKASDDQHDTACILKARSQEYFLLPPGNSSNEHRQAELIEEQDLRKKITDHQWNLCTTDQNLSAEFENITLLSLEDADVLTYVFNRFRRKEFADLLHSEPFYMKNVHINKINKL